MHSHFLRRRISKRWLQQWNLDYLRYQIHSYLVLPTCHSLQKPQVHQAVTHVPSRGHIPQDKGLIKKNQPNFSWICYAIVSQRINLRDSLESEVRLLARRTSSNHTLHNRAYFSLLHLWRRYSCSDLVPYMVPQETSNLVDVQGNSLPNAKARSNPSHELHHGLCWAWCAREAHWFQRPFSCHDNRTRR